MAALPPYASVGETVWWYTFRVICALIFVFLIAPILVIIPLSFNAEDFFTFTPEMLAFDAEGYSFKHYRDFFGTKEDVPGWPWLGTVIGLVLGGGAGWLLGARGVWLGLILLAGLMLGVAIGYLAALDGPWMVAFKNSLLIAPMATLLSVSLGTLAAIGLSQSHIPFRGAIMAILISPMIVPLILTATAMYFFYSEPFGVSDLSIQGTYWSVVLAHAALGVPFVIITVTATMVGFDRSLTRAAASLGANPVRTFFKVQMPLIVPGVISGGLFAFITSFDEVVVVLFMGSADQRTLPWQMFTGLREQISPTILAAATILVAISIALLTTVEMLRRRSERLRGMSPG